MTKRRRSIPRKADTTQATIRMYNVGFGDAFLLFLPTSQGVKRILIDCGSIKANGHEMKSITREIISAVTDEDQVPRIDVIIATHRHRDHISGFAQKGWDRVVVKEVWMPWTEDPENPEAKEIRDLQKRFTLQLEKVFALRPRNEIMDVVFNAKVNEEAMAVLQTGFDQEHAARRRFLPEIGTDNETLRRSIPDAHRQTFSTPALPGIRVHVLGPSRDKDVISTLKPPDEETYQNLIPYDALDGETLRPFSDSKWNIPVKEYHRNEEYRALCLSERERKDFGHSAEDFEELLAAALDGAVNGTSLMLVFQIGETCLFFPGDAQWGTWKAALADPESRELLKNTRFYKIGHHGSHNATPVSFVRDILPGHDKFWAMASVKPVSKWKYIPQLDLLNALHQKSSKIVRSDQLSTETPGFVKKQDLYVEAAIPLH